MQVLCSETVPLRASDDVVVARSRVRLRLAELGFSTVDQIKMATAASELARNAVDHGGGGAMLMEEVRNEARLGVRLTFRDEGPGIPDVDLALTDGYTTGSGLGLGLGGARRLVNEFAIDSAPGRGTTVTVVRWR